MFAYTQEITRKLYIGAVPDSTHNQEWKSLRLLYPKMSLYQEWCNPQSHSSPDDDDEGFVCDLAFSKDGRNLLAASTNGDVYLFNSNTQKLAATVKASSNAILKVLFVGDRNFVTGSSDNAILLWDVRNTQKALNALKGHTNFIRSLDYDETSCKLISSACDCDIRYWHIPSYQLEREDTADSPETANYRGVLFSCPDISQAVVSWCNERMLCINAKGTVFVISNLDIEHLKEDLKHAKFDDSLQLLLSWITPNSSTNRRNSLKIVYSSEYNTNPQFIVSKIHQLAVHPKLPVALIRFSATQRTMHSNRMKDWTSIYKLDQALPVNDLAKFNTLKAFGMDIIEENLLFACEQTRYCTLFEKKPCFSTCGRVVASPEKSAVRLLSFSEKLDMPLSVRSPPAVDTLGMASVWCNEPKTLYSVATIPRDTDSVMCAKFSESGLLLAVGETCGRVSFHLPKL